MIRPMNHTIEMIAAQYETYVRDQARRHRAYDDEFEPSTRRRRSKANQRIAGATDPSEL
ncbi:hypothetical protein [Solicola gregarius]|uniref:Uncharacterized protein n=1 Tax=Solicola gregarius TaxID=2908642 RepID=A0AA46YLW5_9ACTN|nr:hypothetical protein [Solicola gregarius]UYM07092.1 hypothetical protein L0C25_08455 [Solicola gregarius]